MALVSTYGSSINNTSLKQRGGGLDEVGVKTASSRMPPRRAAGRPLHLQKCLDAPQAQIFDRADEFAQLEFGSVIGSSAVRDRRSS